MISSKAKIHTWEEAKEQVKKWKEFEAEVVFTNGCFDIVHLGHIDYLEKARALGDKLIVGINSDASVKRLKGQLRPVVPEYARLRMMAAFSFVDAVVLFTEDTPQQLIKFLTPSILVKGNDYQEEEIVGGDYVKSQGGKVLTIELVAGYSTSGLIERIREL